MKMQSILLLALNTTLFQVSGLSARKNENYTQILNTSAVVLQGQPNTCSADTTERARANLRVQIETLLQQELAISQERPCGCGAAIEGWRRVAFVNMTDSTQTCPGEWSLRLTPKRTCQRSFTDGCSAASFSSGGQTYNEVCGRLVGYQRGPTNGFWHPINEQHNAHPDAASHSNTVYDGGVLITHGNIPRQHIWSLVSGYSQQRTDSHGCPCNIGSTINIDSLPSWLGQDYFCDSAVAGSSTANTFYPDNPLWDGVGCDETLTTCCQFNNPPWFCKPLPQPTSDDIELRLCADDTEDNTPIELVEIYVR